MTKKGKKTEHINLRLSTADKKKIAKNAKKNNMSITDYMLQTALYNSIDKDKINGAKARVAYCELMELVNQKLETEDANMIMERGTEIWDTIVMR